MKTIEIWIPHLGKAGALNSYQPGMDLSDPPLATGEKEKAEELTRKIFALHGKPDLICVALNVRCQESAAYAASRFGNIGERNSALVLGLNTLAQPDSWDYNPTHPKARKDGFVVYGRRSFAPEWYNLFCKSHRIISAAIRESRRKGVVWVITGRPILAAARFAAHNGMVIPKRGDINNLDKTLLPYCVFRSGGKTRWEEIPRE